MRLIVFVFLFIFTGCASLQAPGYISRIDHPYNRKFYASFEKVTSLFMYVLKKQGWTIANEVDPAIYERDDRYDDRGYQNLLIITEAKRSNRVLYSTVTHLNVLLHSFANTCDVEIRYESRTGLVKQFISTRNDRMVEDILNKVEQELNR